MTARPTVPESRGRSENAAVALALVMVAVLLAVLLAAGCTGPAQDTSAAATISPTRTIPMSDKELAEKTIADAEDQIDKADSAIGWLKGNMSTRNDTMLPVIITRREISFSYLSTAKDEFANGNYEMAVIKAQEAYYNANESFKNALERQHYI